MQCHKFPITNGYKFLRNCIEGHRLDEILCGFVAINIILIGLIYYTTVSLEYATLPSAIKLYACMVSGQRDTQCPAQADATLYLEMPCVVSLTTVFICAQRSHRRKILRALQGNLISQCHPNILDIDTM